MMKEKQKTNRILTIVLILGTVTVFFPLYMAAIIAFKKPSEMTNDVAGALSFPKQWSFENFRQAMEVTDFWHSLGNSLLITLVTIVLAILIHSIAGYVIGRGMARRKKFPFYLSVYCQWYVCSVFHLNDASGKTDGTYGTWKPCGCHSVVSGILYANECPALQWIFKKYSGSAGRGGRY